MRRFLYPSPPYSSIFPAHTKRRLMSPPSFFLSLTSHSSIQKQTFTSSDVSLPRLFSKESTFRSSTLQQTNQLFLYIVWARNPAITTITAITSPLFHISYLHYNSQIGSITKPIQHAPFLMLSLLHACYLIKCLTMLIVSHKRFACAHS